jgi:hypothetical protein
MVPYLVKPLLQSLYIGLTQLILTLKIKTAVVPNLDSENLEEVVVL